MGYVRLGLARFFTITQEITVVERNRLQIRDLEFFLHVIDGSYAQIMLICFPKHCPKSRDHPCRHFERNFNGIRVEFSPSELEFNTNIKKKLT